MVRRCAKWASMKNLWWFNNPIHGKPQTIENTYVDGMIHKMKETMIFEGLINDHRKKSNLRHDPNDLIWSYTTREWVKVSIIVKCIVCLRNLKRPATLSTDSNFVVRIATSRHMDYISMFVYIAVYLWDVFNFLYMHVLFWDMHQFYLILHFIFLFTYFFHCQNWSFCFVFYFWISTFNMKSYLRTEQNLT